MRPNTARIIGRLCVVCMVAFGTGCAGLNFPFRRQPDIVEATARNPAREITCIWQSAEGSGPNGVPTRGMAGQILFFTPKSDSPAKVDGDVRVYLFDDQGTVEEQAKPIHQFDFTAGAWNTHLRMSTLGPSYQVFIPYSRPGHHQAKCSLRMRFKSSEGRTIYSEPVDVTLPGTIESDDSVPLGVDPVPIANRKLRVDTAGRVVNRHVKPTSLPTDETHDAGPRFPVASFTKPDARIRREEKSDPNIRLASGVEESTSAEESPDDTAVEQRLDRLESALSEFVEESRRARRSGANRQGPRPLPRRLTGMGRKTRDATGDTKRHFERQRFQDRRSSDVAGASLGQPRISRTQPRGAEWSEHPLGDQLESSDREGSVRPGSATGRDTEKAAPRGR